MSQKAELLELFTQLDLLENVIQSLQVTEW
jgi:hypothetical protein